MKSQQPLFQHLITACVDRECPVLLVKDLSVQFSHISRESNGPVCVCFRKQVTPRCEYRLSLENSFQ